MASNAREEADALERSTLTLKLRHHRQIQMPVIMGIALESLLIVLALFVVAGGGIVVIDAYIIRRIRRLGPPTDEASADRRIDQ